MDGWKLLKESRFVPEVTTARFPTVLFFFSFCLVHMTIYNYVLVFVHKAVHTLIRSQTQFHAEREN